MRAPAFVITDDDAPIRWDRFLPDKGCRDLGIPACLSCPRPRCRYDEEGGEPVSVALTRERNAEVVGLALARIQEGRRPAIGELSIRYGLSRRQVQRIIQEGTR